MQMYTHDPVHAPDDEEAISLFDGPGEMRARCRAFDWSDTSLGSASTWSLSIRAVVRTMLASRHPMFVWLGPELIQLFNDGYLPLFGAAGRDRAALGVRGKAHWPEIWDVIGPQIDGVMMHGASTWHEDQLVPIERNGRLEQVYWTYGYSPVFDDDGSIGGTLVVCTETTQRVQSAIERERQIADVQQARAEAERAREDLARVFAQAPVAIAVLDGRELRYTVANAEYQQTIGARDPVGKTLVEMFPELAGSEIERIIQAVYDTAVPFIANDLLIRFDSRGTGEIDNYYDLVYQPLVDERGTTEGIVVIAVDVTDRRAALLERELLLREAQEARAASDHASRAKSEFLAVMSHELRTPLNAIGGYAELIEMGIRGPVTADQRLDLARIQTSQRHLLGLINGVLNYTRVEAGAVHYDIRDVLLDEVLTTCETLTAPQIRARGLTLAILVVDRALGVRADAEKLQQIVLNLLTNAIKFTAVGGHIELSCTAEATTVQISVRDDGCGIAMEHIVRIFEPFVQVDVRLARSNEGVGLGLAISRDLARGMHGDLTAESTPGVGSTFTLTLVRAL